MNITVYLGACEGCDPQLRRAVRELGTWIGTSGNSLVYGGSKTGLMGELASAALEAGAEVTGVEPQFFVESVLQLEGLTRLIVTPDIAQRKAKMIELGDAFVAFPGGTGTLEEISQIMSMIGLGQLDAPCVFYNLNGYYNPMAEQLDRMLACDLTSPERLRGISFARNLDELAACLQA